MKSIWFLLKNYGISFMLLSISAVSLCMAGYMLLKVEDYASESRLSVKENTPGLEHTVKDSYITVDMSGAVRQPGALRLKSGSRLSEALRLSGGVTSDASQEFIQHIINQAQILADEQKIYIPTEKEFAEVAQQSNASQLTNSTQIGENIPLQSNSITDVSNLISLNSASSSQLEELPGIGEITAAKIIASRPFSTLDELVSKKVLSQSVLDKIRTQVML